MTVTTLKLYFELLFIFVIFVKDREDYNMFIPNEIIYLFYLFILFVSSTVVVANIVCQELDDNHPSCIKILQVTMKGENNQDIITMYIHACKRSVKYYNSVFH